MFARMKDNLIERYEKANPNCMDSEIASFLARIDGQIVELVFTGPDAFEKDDNNIWLPNELWEEV